MKENLYKIARQSKKPKVLVMCAGIVVFVIGLLYFSNGANVSAEIKDKAPDVLETESSLVSVVGKNDFSSPLGNSWPAEIISNQISQIQPQREGVISGWSVRIGEAVYQGQVLGKISAPPGTPELISMLSEQTESLAMAKATAEATDDYTSKEQTRLYALEQSLSGSAEKPDQIFGALNSLKENAKVKQEALRSFVERALANHVAMATNFSNWRYVRYGGLNRGLYGVSNPNVQNSYETSLITLSEKLKAGAETPIPEAQAYFELAVQLANSSGSDAADFKTEATADQEDFLDFLSEYREAQAEVADKETEYKLMIREQSAMLDKEKAMAAAGLIAARQAYSTVYGEIKGETYIKAPRSGTISAIYKKVGDLVGPEMAIAVIAEKGDANLIVRMRIPNNVIKPNIGDILKAIRPGFPNDRFEVKIVGIGSSLDETGSYMADAVFLKSPDWPVQSSVRVLQPESSTSESIPSGSLLWDESGSPYVWSVSSADRIYKTNVKIGRLLGTSVEIYEGLKDGDRYITNPNSEIRENMLLEEIVDVTKGKNGNDSSESRGHDNMPGMEM
ncbi:MAG: HlyD family efflux transporter periplasmic adaptor subunit [Candidatus Taylorbacteria bacterium]|nr:HlyD family efflux transporter periplasmic adaptor subunit [Candidatus Taylorbacteria bacterium]